MQGRVRREKVKRAAKESASFLASRKQIASSPAMRTYIFFSGLVIVAMGIAAMSILAKPDSVGFLQGALTLGGGIVICGAFSMKMKWHGIIGAGILAMLGAARGLGNLPGLVKFLTGERPRGSTPVLEMGVTLICLLLLLKIIRVLSQERVRRMLEAAKEEE